MHSWLHPLKVVNIQCWEQAGSVLYYGLVELSSALCFAQGDSSLGSETIEFWDFQFGTMSEKWWDGFVLYILPHTEGGIFKRLWHLALEMSFVGFNEMKVLRKNLYHVLHFLPVNSRHAHCYQASPCSVFAMVPKAWSLQHWLWFFPHELI